MLTSVTMPEIPALLLKVTRLPLQARAFHGTYLDPNLEIQIPLQVAAEREITRSYFAAGPGGRTLAAADWNVNITEFAHPPVTAEHSSAAVRANPARQRVSTTSASRPGLSLSVRAFQTSGLAWCMLVSVT